MFSLSKLFNKRHVVSVDRNLLLDTVKPFLKNAKEYTNKDIADGWDEAVEWLRIGFHFESDKGTNYQAMRRALILITRQIQNAPEGETIDIRKEDLAMLRSCSASASVNKVTAVPGRPARPVRPMRWM